MDWEIVCQQAGMWERVKEAVWLGERQESVYANGVFTDSPFWVLVLKPLVCLDESCHVLVLGVFLVFHLLFAGLLVRLFHSPFAGLLHLVNPISIFSILAKDPLIIIHVFIILSILFRQSLFKSALFSSMCLTLEPRILPVSLAILFISPNKQKHALYLITSIFTLFILLLILFPLNDLYQGLFILPSTISLTPNMGMFWYLFTEMFPSALQLYTVLLQLVPLLLVYPLYTRFKTNSTFYMYTILATSYFFRPTTTLADFTFVFYFYTFNYETFAKHSLTLFPIPHAIVCLSTAIALTMSLLWEYHSSGNPNFYFIQNMLFQFASAFIFIDSLTAFRLNH